MTDLRRFCCHLLSRYAELTGVDIVRPFADPPQHSSIRGLFVEHMHWRPSGDLHLMKHSLTVGNAARRAYNGMTNSTARFEIFENGIGAGGSGAISSHCVTKNRTWVSSRGHHPDLFLLHTATVSSAQENR
jgi:hypothetical protein